MMLPGRLREFLGATSVPPQAGRLARLLAVSVDELAAIRMGPRYHYRPRTVAKRDGRTRQLFAPSPALKQLQRRLLDEYLSRLPIHPSATAFHRHASIVRNARMHAHQRFIATVDLKDFFPATSATRVRRFFVSQSWRGDELGTLMRLCVTQNGLPQGAPTSPALSNLVNVPLDERLARLARQSGGVYSRYGDDLTFSWGESGMPGNFRPAIDDALAHFGYEVQPKKAWRYGPVSDHPIVTGIVLTGHGRMRMPWKVRWRILSLRWQKLWTNDVTLRHRLEGYSAYRRMIES